jgi:uncharacterized membrane protein YhaH (DUF805 family)
MAKRNWLQFYSSFKGRATRYDFNVYYALVMFIGSIVAGLIDWSIQGEALITQNAPTIFSNAWNVIIIWPTLAVTCRRLHDLDYSGWWQAAVYLLPIVFIGFLVMTFGFAILGNPFAAGTSMILAFLAIVIFYLGFFVILSCIRGTKGPNRFGADPLEVIHVTE